MLLATIAVGCTDDFESTNSDPNKLYNIELRNIFPGTVYRTMNTISDLNYYRMWFYSRQMAMYKYDERFRCVKKRLPGTDWIYQVFDQKNRIVMTQDGKDRLEDKWTYCVYDYFDQVIEQSIVTGTLSRDLIQERFDDPNFYNNLPYLGGTNDIHKPFSDDTFSVVDVLASTAYGNGRYEWGFLVKEALSQDQFLRYDENKQFCRNIKPTQIIVLQGDGLRVNSQILIIFVRMIQ